MKKVLSLVLVLALVLGSFGMAFADTDTTAAAATTTTPKDVVGTDYEGAVTALSALGVVSGYEDGNYKPANIVTRAEMAKLIIAELGLTGNATGAKSTFTDLSGYGWAEGFIGYAQSLGIINGYGDGTFKPGQSVSYDEALTMIVSALGYTKDCKEMNGSWPAIYVQKARVLGITDDVKAGGAVGANRGDIAIYLYNMLTADMGYADNDGKYQNKLDKDSNPIKVIANLDAKESTNSYEGYQIIDKADADDSLVNIRPYVGSFAKVFTLTKGKNDGKIIAISDVKSDFITGEYDAANKKLTTADGTEYKLDDVMTNISGTSTEKYLKDATKAVEFVNGDRNSAGATILDSNGKALDTATAKDGRFVTIAADLSGKTVKGVYSVIMWGTGTDATVVAEKVEADDLTSIKSNKTLLGKEFTQNDNDEIDLSSFELIGVDSLDDIKADNVVYVYTGGKDKEITRVAVGTEVVTGEITKIKETGTNKITIGGKDYKLVDQKLINNGITADLQTGELDVEDEVKLYLDAYGYAFASDQVSGKADNYAVILEVGNGSGSVGSKKEMKLLLADGTDKVFNVDNDLFKGTDKVTGFTDDATWGSNSTAVINGKLAGQLIKYGVDKDGVLDSIEKINTESDYHNITALGGLTTISDVTKNGYYNGYEVKKDAVIFSYDHTSTAAIATDSTSMGLRSDEDEYGTTTLEKLLGKEDLCAAYVVYKNKIVSMLIYDYSDSDAIYGVVTGAKKTSGDSDYEISMLVDGASKTYGATATPYNFVKNNDSATADGTSGGKLFKIEFNASGEIKALTPANSASEQLTGANGDTWGYVAVTTNGNDVYKNNVYSVSNGAIGANTPGYVTGTNKEVRLDNKATVYYNDNGDFVTGTLNDLRGLKSGSKVWFFDTKDDKNTLMDIAVINKAEGSIAGGDTVTPDANGVGIVSGNVTTDSSIVVTLSLPVGNTTWYKVEARDAAGVATGTAVTTATSRQLTAKDLGLTDVGSIDYNYTILVSTSKDATTWTLAKTGTLTSKDGLKATMSGSSTQDGVLGVKASGSISTVSAGGVATSITLSAIHAGTDGNGYTLALTSTAGIDATKATVNGSKVITVALETDPSGKILATIQDVIDAVANYGFTKDVVKVEATSADAAKVIGEALAATGTTSNGAGSDAKLTLIFDKDMKASDTATLTVGGHEYTGSVLWSNKQTAVVTIKCDDLKAGITTESITKIDLVRANGNSVDLGDGVALS